MRMLVIVDIPHEPMNGYVRDGSAGPKIQRILEHSKPEAVYFTEREGRRGAILVVDMDDSSQIPFYAEPWFLTFKAQCEFRIAMTPEDLGKSDLAALGKAW
jgi:hypothetical protein